MNYLFLMDPLEKVSPEKDTTLALMLGAHRKGHTVYYVPKNGVSHSPEQTLFDAVEVVPDKSVNPPFQIKQKLQLNQDQVDALFIRTEPPFDEQYLIDTWLLDDLAKRIPVINNPTGIRTVNEKIWASQFKEIVPKTLITHSKEQFREFLEEQKQVILKPTDGFGGQSVFSLLVEDTNADVAFESITHYGQKHVVVQQYIEASKKGDKRILLLDGEPLGAVLRISEKGHRNNFLSGGKPVKTDISDNDLKIIDLLKPHLKKLGLYFVGIDIIGDYLIEVNVTSPTCLQEMNRLYDQQLEDEVIHFVENFQNFL